MFLVRFLEIISMSWLKKVTKFSSIGVSLNLFPSRYGYFGLATPLESISTL